MKYGINIFEDLNNEKIQYIVWKNTNLIGKFFNGQENLDIYIHKDNHDRFKFLLKKNNWIEVKSTSNNFDQIKHYLFFDYNKILHIHAYYKFFTGNSISKNYDLSNFINYFQNKDFDKKYKIWILNHDIQLLLFNIRLAIKKKSLLGRYLISREKNYYNEEISYILSNTKFKKKYKNENELLKSIKKFKRVSSFQTFLSEILFLKNIFFQKLLKLKKFKLNKNYIIFLSGPDSSGKTSFTNDLKYLIKSHFKTKIFSIGKPYPNFLIKILIKKNLFKKGVTANLLSKNLETNYLKLLKNINLAIFRYIYSINIFYFNKSSSIIILDRYVSEFVGHINGPRSNTNYKSSSIKKFLSYVETFFYKKTNFIDHEYKILTDLNNCLIRNNKRYKAVKKSDHEITRRFINYNNSIFKSKKIFKIDNNLDKKTVFLNLLNIISKNINEVN